MKRRNTAINNLNPFGVQKDKFWQEQVKRLMQETKNIKHLQSMKEKDTRSMANELSAFKKKYNTLKLKYDELRIHSLYLTSTLK